ncbi:pyridoxamine 5'-phosphate oxidase family protein [Actinomadura sp. DC4]|uniref:pyridoxamine 5'-phosphate oxidase family protein n=1 Tax=Actinomadura sp. DC4 TaxID=3055069 RepID=UPI0025B23FE7|nr:pyridoxamine 5'-phosphate oxidase family protein [Actinomadura sp. DC4]MDN3352916.1 pyridoxamine 5'-phosphate oxidase family protein [Actinomadura sp. DC4]
MADLVSLARSLITDNLYMALGTADASGVPWVSPVFFTPEDDSTFLWVSSPDARHSRNIAVRPSVGITIYDSRSEVGRASAVYMSAVAHKVPADSSASALAVFNGRLPASQHITVEELQGLFRLYRATVTEHSVLIRGGDPEYGKGADSRMTVTLPGKRTG